LSATDPIKKSDMRDGIKVSAIRIIHGGQEH
jgi:hypothetical protein